MKKSKWYLLVFFLVLILGKILVNNTRFIWTFNSSSIEESKSKGSYICEYEIYDMTIFSQKDSSILKDLVIWKEKQMTTEPFLIFFHPLRPTNRESLIVKSELLKGKEWIHAKLENNGYSGNQKGNHIVLTEDKFNEEENVLVYRSTKDRLGLIKIREKI